MSSHLLKLLIELFIYLFFFLRCSARSEERDLNASKHDVCITIAKALHVIQALGRSVIVAASLNVIEMTFNASSSNYSLVQKKEQLL